MKKTILLGLLAILVSTLQVFAQVAIKDEINQKALQQFQKEPKAFLVNWSKGKLISYQIHFEDKTLAEKFQEGVHVVVQGKIFKGNEEVYATEPTKGTLFPGNIFFPGNILFPGTILEPLESGSYELRIEMQVRQSEIAEMLGKYPRVIPFKFKIQ